MQNKAKAEHPLYIHTVLAQKEKKTLGSPLKKLKILVDEEENCSNYQINNCSNK